MKILFHAYDTCCQTESGGVQVRIRKIKKILEEKGIQVNFFNPYETNLRDYDVLHIFMLRPDTANLINCAKTLGLKVVLSSIVNIENSAWHIQINRKLAPLYRRLGFTTTDNIKYGAIHNCDFIIAETPHEKRFISMHYNISKESIYVIPNGVEEIGTRSEKIFDLIGKKCKYVIQVGRIDENKNLLNTIRAIKGANYDLVVIGGSYSVYNSGYYERCLKEAEGCTNIHFLGWLEAGSEELLSAYCNAHALILPSYSETFGLAATEAAVAGCHVCLSNTLPIIDYEVFDKDLTFNPHKVSEIRQVLDRTMAIPKDDTLRQKAKAIFSWEKIAEEHIEIYKRCTK